MGEETGSLDVPSAGETVAVRGGELIDNSRAPDSGAAHLAPLPSTDGSVEISFHVGYAFSRRVAVLLSTEMVAGVGTLSTNASLSEARLRLGRVAYLLEDASEARARFEDVLHSDRDTPAAFLAHLFLGRLEEDTGRLDEARRAYESALALDPGSQPARLALSHVDLRSTWTSS